MNHDVICQACIQGTFYGFDGDTIFALDDGTFWLQAEYKYWYHYEYQPEVEIISDGRCGYHIRVEAECPARRGKPNGITG